MLKYPKNVFSQFEHKTISVAGLAEILWKSPRKLFIFIIIKVYLYFQSIKKTNYLILKKTSLETIARGLRLQESMLTGLDRCDQQIHTSSLAKPSSWEHSKASMHECGRVMFRCVAVFSAYKLESIIYFSFDPLHVIVCTNKNKELLLFISRLGVLLLFISRLGV